MDEKDWQFYIDAMKRIIKRMLPNFGGDIVTGLRLIEEELAQKEARIRELEEFAGKVLHLLEYNDDNGYWRCECCNVRTEEKTVVHAGNCCVDELKKALLETEKVSDKSNQSDKEDAE